MCCCGFQIMSSRYEKWIFYEVHQMLTHETEFASWTKFYFCLCPTPLSLSYFHTTIKCHISTAMPLIRSNNKFYFHLRRKKWIKKLKFRLKLTTRDSQRIKTSQTIFHLFFCSTNKKISSHSRVRHNNILFYVNWSAENFYYYCARRNELKKWPAIAMFFFY
jgi:hypothetical protein